MQRALPLVFACLSLLPALAPAASLTVNPIRLDIGPRVRATSLVVTNQSEQGSTLQVRLFHWEHSDGADKLTEATGDSALIVTPPIFRLAGHGASQVVRIGFLDAPERVNEQQWRVVVEELPAVEPVQEGTQAPSNTFAVTTRLRISLPLLVSPERVHKALDWTLRRGPGASWTLDALNLGTVTERLDRVEVARGTQVLDTLRGPVYLFPAERRSFPLAAGLPADLRALQLSVVGTAPPRPAELTVSAQ